jgi:hypothetical protein
LALHNTLLNFPTPVRAFFRSGPLSRPWDVLTLALGGMDVQGGIAHDAHEC